MKKEYLTKSAGQTKKLGEALAETLLKSRLKNKAIIIGLKGDLGGGKTTFLQGFARGLGIKARVLSPTFIVMRRIGDFYHIDCYRLQGPQDLLKLGIKKILADPKNIVAIEWVEKVRQLLPKNIILIEFEVINKSSRKISFDR